MGTADLVLSRFPRHLDADGPGKIIGDVVTALATAAETQTVQVGRVRSARRLGELDQIADLARVIGLHGLGLAMFAALDRRVRDADPSVVAHDDWLDVARRMVVDLVAAQRDESGTVAGILDATAAYLGYSVTELDHDPGGYWHLARCADQLMPGDPTDPVDHLLALEENPPRLSDLGPSPFTHAASFSVMRQGFDEVPATVIVNGVENRTVRPIVVNVDDGFGVAATFAVPDGGELRFERDGRVELDGAGVARSCYTFSGAVFADEGVTHPKDFVFDDEAAPPDPELPRPTDDRRGTYSVTQPIGDGFDPSPSFPHGDSLLGAVRLDRRETRFAVFVGAGSFAAELGDGTIVDAAPDPRAGFFDETVFQPDPPPAGAPSFEIGFEWDEREAYAVRVWIPLDLQDLDRDAEAPIAEVIRGLLDRHRAAGVHVYVEHADPRWTLGTGVIRDLGSDNALGVVVAGTETWDDDAEQPGGGSP